jgi:hypothetical protein
MRRRAERRIRRLVALTSRRVGRLLSTLALHLLLPGHGAGSARSRIAICGYGEAEITRGCECVLSERRSLTTASLCYFFREQPTC